MCQDVIKEFGLREAVGAEEQTYALGLKEVWEVRGCQCSATVSQQYCVNNSHGHNANVTGSRREAQGW